MRLCLIFIFLSVSLCSLSQEICDNGIDDDGDGLIDLNDSTDCFCEGLILADSTLQPSLIPNSSFEEKLCCPDSYTQLYCANLWEQASDGTSDYMNTCDYVPPAVLDQNLVPFPDGEGAVGAIYQISYKEYVGGCLTEPLLAGHCYQLNFYIASTPSNLQGYTCNNGNIFYDDVPVTIFGNQSCLELPFSGEQCPPSADGWLELGSQNYTPSSNWNMITIEFTPTTDINALIFGPPCTLPGSYTYATGPPVPCIPYFVYDKLILKEGCGYQLGINNSYNEPCADSSTLTAYTDQNGGTWQWYFDGVAIQGETDSVLHLDSQSNMNGTYTVIFQTGLNCFGASYTVGYFPPDEIYIQETACSSFYWEETGIEYEESGNYQAIIESSSGCDSIINLYLEINHEESTYLDTIICHNDTLSINGINYTTSGSYNQTMTTGTGCDSVLYIDLFVADSTAPKIVFSEPECLGEIVTLTTLQEPTYSLYWTLPSGDVIQGNEIQIIYENSTIGEYYLTESYGGCTSGFDVIELYDNYNSLDLNKLIVPNIITPNNDNVNDELKISGIPEGCYYSLEILNRWGNLVYTQTESSNLFSGNSNNGKVLSEGVYFYVLKFGDYQTSGFIHINR